MNPIVMFRNSEGMDAVAMRPGCMSCHLATVTGNTSAELAWELFDIFDSGMFPFPIDDHDSARDIVRYLLERGILDEEIADAIKDSAADMNVWLDHGDKYMVGEWVIAWINACRDRYSRGRRKSEAAAAGRPGQHRLISASPDWSHDSGGYSTTDDDDDDDDNNDNWREGIADNDGGGGPDVGEESSGTWITTDIGSSSVISSGLLTSFSSNSHLSFSQSQPNLHDRNRHSLSELAKMEDLEHPLPPTPFERLASFLQLSDFNADVIRCQAISDQGIKCDNEWIGQFRRDIWPSISPDLGCVLTETNLNQPLDNVTVHDDGTVLHTCQQCRCKLPHYLRNSTTVVPSSEDKCVSCRETIRRQRTHDGRTPIHNRHSSKTSNIKYFAIRALEYSMDTTDRSDGPGYVYVMADMSDGGTLRQVPGSDARAAGRCARHVTWTDERRYKIASSRHPERCLTAFRSRDLDVDLVWQVKVNRHAKAASEIQTALEKHRLHCSWFKCSLSAVMEVVSQIIGNY